MFDFDGDLILFQGQPVARFEPSAWPTLRDEVVHALQTVHVDAPTEEEWARLKEEVDCLQTELRTAQDDIRDYVRQISRLTQQLDTVRSAFPEGA